MIFVERSSAEARFARALDGLQPMLENVRAGGGTWRDGGITADRVLAKVEQIEDGSAGLGSYGRALIGQAVTVGILTPAPAPRAGGGHATRAGRGPRAGHDAPPGR
jgi:putative hydrolases of HD superfamily